MFHWFAKRAAPLAVLALGVTVAGCSYSYEWDEVEGVPLAELDMSGDAPATIQLAGPDKIVISEGEGLTITLEGNAEAGEALRFDRDGDRLTIARDRSVYDGNGSAIVLISMPAPSNLEIAGSGNIESFSMASEAEIEIAGSGGITVESIAAESLSVDIAGAGEVVAAGTAQTLSVSIAGSGDVRLGDLMADDVSVSIAGSGDVEVASNGTVKADIAGSGDVIVNGSASCSVQTAGSGSLTCTSDSASDAAASSTDETEETATEEVTEEDAAAE